MGAQRRSLAVSRGPQAGDVRPAVSGVRESANLLTELPRPFIVAVATDRTAGGMRETIVRAAEAGAHAVELNLPAIADVTARELQSLLAGSPVPVYTTCRRARFMEVYGFREGEVPDWPDEERMKRQLAALHRGSRALDMEMDTFDPHPAPPMDTRDASAVEQQPGDAFELTGRPEAIERHRDIIGLAHGAGAEVILSCHTGRPQTGEQLLAIGKEAARRGGDLLKIVTPCRNGEDLLALLHASLDLRRSLPIPFVLVGGGRPGLISRTIGPHFGSSWVIAQVERKSNGFQDQPLVREITQALKLLPGETLNPGPSPSSRSRENDAID